MERLTDKSFEVARSLPVEVEISTVSTFVNGLPNTVPTSWSWFNFNTILMIIGITTLITSISLISLSPQAEAKPTVPTERVSFEIKAPIAEASNSENPVVFALAQEVETPLLEVQSVMAVATESQVEFSLIASVNEDEISEITMELPNIVSPAIPSDSVFVEINADMTNDEIRSQIQFAKEHGVCLCRCNWRRIFGGKVRKMSMNVKTNNECFQRLELKGFESIRFDWKLVGDEVVEFHKSVNGGERSEVSVAPGTHTRGIYKFN